MLGKALTSRVVGYLGSLVLTMATFFIVVYFPHLHLETTTGLLTILALALTQALLQCICFLHLWNEKGIPWNLVMFSSTIFMVVVIIAFSVWIMNHLNYNMMPQM